MDHVRMDDFQRQPNDYLRAGSAVAIDEDDRTVGYYVPVPSAYDEEFRRAMSHLDETLQHILTRTGMTEDDLADLLDPAIPLQIDGEPETPAPSASGY